MITTQPRQPWEGYLIIAAMILLTIILLFSCTTLGKATHYLNDHPTDAAAYCGAKFPVTDSIGQPGIVVSKSENEDYRALIDSLNKNAVEFYSYKDGIVPQTKLWWPDSAQHYNAAAKKLSDQIFRLNAKYKPCTPDTLRMTLPVYRTNNARVFEYIGLYANQKAKSDQYQAAESKWRGRAVKCFWLIGITLLLTTLSVYLRFRGIKLF